MNLTTKILLFFYHTLVMALIPVLTLTLLSRDVKKNDSHIDISKRFSIFQNTSWLDEQEIFTISNDKLFHKDAREKAEFYFDYFNISYLNSFIFKDNNSSKSKSKVSDEINK